MAIFANGTAILRVAPLKPTLNPESLRRALLEASTSWTLRERSLQPSQDFERDKQWSSNDVYDIDAMALAVPYCDIVVTERACCHALMVAGTDQRMNTVVLRDLTRLPEVLMDWKTA